MRHGIRSEAERLRSPEKTLALRLHRGPNLQKQLRHHSTRLQGRRFPLGIRRVRITLFFFREGGDAQDIPYSSSAIRQFWFLLAVYCLRFLTSILALEIIREALFS
jgi:hypothetical protein